MPASPTTARRSRVTELASPEAMHRARVRTLEVWTHADMSTVPPVTAGPRTAVVLFTRDLREGVSVYAQEREWTLAGCRTPDYPSPLAVAA